MNKVEFVVRLVAAPVTEFEKRFQASRPAKVKGKYGTPPLERCATRPNTKLNKPAEIIGEMSEPDRPKRRLPVHDGDVPATEQKKELAGTEDSP